MTLIRHSDPPFIFLKTRKTAGSSVEAYLLDYLDTDDEVSTSTDPEPLDRPFWSTPNVTTGWTTLERSVKTRARKLNVHRMRLREHMDAQRVKRHVGAQAWARYFKFCIERDPVDRFLSLWRWYNRKNGTAVSLEWMLATLESGDSELIKARGLHHWTNWSIYTIDHELAVDRVIRYERLHEELPEVLSRLGIPWNGDLPYYKVTQGGGSQEKQVSESQQTRIRELYRNELDLLYGQGPDSTRGRDTSNHD